ncbi:AraC family transcriptional regulator [Marinomonas epiphytica]
MQVYKIETDELGKEQVTHGTKEFPCAFYDEYFSLFFNQEVSWHWHEEIELVLVVEGCCKVQCLNEEIQLKQGEMIFINANTLHYMKNEAHAECRIQNAVFSPHMLAGIPFGSVYQKHILPIIQNKALPMFHFTANIPWQAELIHKFSKAVLAWCSEQADREFIATLTLMEIWHALSTHANSQSVMLSPGTRTQQKRLEHAIEFISQHYYENLSTKVISGAANMSESECYRLFRTHLQCTPNHYLTQYRLRIAAQLLAQQNLAINDVAFEAGFNSVAYFGKMFKRMFGDTPKQFQRKAGVDQRINNMTSLQTGRP